MISHDYKCIFIHIPKCGGMSIQNKFLVNRSKPELLLGKNKDPQKGPPRLNHLIGEDYILKKHISKQDFDAYYKFSFVRNPWARVVSLYKYLGYFQIMTFDTFVQKYFEKDLFNSKEWFWFVRPQYDYIYNSDNELMVDFLGRTENLNNDFKEICKHINFKDHNLLHINKSTEKSKFNTLFLKTLWSHPTKILSYNPNRDLDKKTYKDYYSDTSKKIIFKFYEIDIDTFKYTF